MSRLYEIDQDKINRLKREAQQFQDDIVCSVGTDFMQKIAEAENRMIFDILKGLEADSSADVVPKSEVVNILDILIKEAGEIAESYKVRIAELNGLEYADRVKSEYIGTQVGALLVQLRIAQLKKKYTEDNNG